MPGEGKGGESSSCHLASFSPWQERFLDELPNSHTFRRWSAEAAEEDEEELEGVKESVGNQRMAA